MSQRQASDSSGRRAASAWTGCPVFSSAVRSVRACLDGARARSAYWRAPMRQDGFGDCGVQAASGQVLAGGATELGPGPGAVVGDPAT